jgi:outer membrane protein assembly factor BamB
VKWKLALPGTSSATPVVSGNRVFLVSNNADETQVYAICVGADTGQSLWQKLLADNVRNTARNTMASCSPVTDGKTVYFLAGNGDLMATDFDGNVVWSKNLQSDYGLIGQQFGYSSSPLLHAGRLYLPILRGQWENRAAFSSYSDKDSHIVCLAADTGQELWKAHRVSDANGESFDSYASAVPYTFGGTDAIIVQGGDYLSANDAATGKELWRQFHNPRKDSNWRLIPSPIVVEDIVIGLQPRGGNAFAVKPGENMRYDYDDSFWIYQGRTADVPTPAVYDGKVYILIGTTGELICLDPRTGAELWTGEFETSARVWSSPTVADGKLYCVDENGQVTIASITGGFEVLSQSDFGGSVTKSSIAIAGGSLYIRTAEALYRAGG